MSEAKSPIPVNLIAGMLTALDGVFERAEETLKEYFGDIDLRSDAIPFTFTDYYRETMGEGIRRRFLSFKRLIDPGRIAEIKLATNKIEEDFKKMGYPAVRPVNIDPGYITPGKLVLASTKDYYHRIYLGRCIYAEVTLRYTKGRFETFPWTYPDYKSQAYMDFFSQVRQSYMSKLHDAPLSAKDMTVQEGGEYAR